MTIADNKTFEEILDREAEKLINDKKLLDGLIRKTETEAYLQ